MMARKSISDAVRRAVLFEAGYRCAVPTCRRTITHEIHHLVHVSRGGINAESNLIALCGYCHDLYHSGHIPDDAIKTWKTMLVSLNNSFTREAIDYLLVLAHPEKIGLYPTDFYHEDGVGIALTGDGVLRLSSLVVSGLVRVRMIGARYSAGQAEQNFMSFITDKGKRLVEAWERGNLGEFNAVLGEK